MVGIKDCIITVINGGNYNAEELEAKIEVLWINGKLTDEERSELIAAAYENARDFNQIDVMEKLTGIQNSLFDIENRVYALEHKDDPEPEPVPEYAEWYAGYITKKGETVLYDYDKDGTLDYLRYDGGRDSTSLRPGRIDGWYVVDENGEILGTFYGDTFTPVNPEPEESEPETPAEPNEGEGE